LRKDSPHHHDAGRDHNILLVTVKDTPLESRIPDNEQNARTSASGMGSPAAGHRKFKLFLHIALFIKNICGLTQQRLLLQIKEQMVSQLMPLFPAHFLLVAEPQWLLCSGLK